MKFYVLIGIILILVLPGCKSHKQAVDVIGSQTDTIVAKDSIGVSATTEKDWLSKIFAADSIGFWLIADSIVTPSGGTLYNPRMEIGAVRANIGMERRSERTENSLTEMHESMWHTATVTENKVEKKGAVSVAEPIEKSDKRWIIICVCVVVTILLLSKKNI